MKKRNAGGALLVLILVVLSVLVGEDLLSELGLTGGFNAPVVVSEQPATADWYEIYFTNPTCPPEDQRSGGLDAIVAEDIAQAEVRADVAAYDLDAEPIVDALIGLAEQGVVVRVVTDTDNEDLVGIRRLRRSGISVIPDDRSGLMHNKFVVIDGRFVWMGSMNFTTNGAYCNNNNLVRFDSPRLAANYTAEMDELYVERLFGPRSPLNTPNEQLNIGGVRLENHFGPEKELAPIIAQSINGAEEEILFLAFSFTNEQIGEAVLDRADAGVTVRGVFETVGSDTEFSYFPPMQAANLANLSVRTDGNPRIMHHKVFIIDRATVIFGSFNFSDNANQRNDENIVIVHDPTFAGFFVEEFEAVWNEATP